MNVEKSFCPRKTQKARKYSATYKTADHHLENDWLTQHTKNDLFRGFRVFRGQIRSLE
jgi:hypothetical protein